MTVLQNRHPSSKADCGTKGISSPTQRAAGSSLYFGHSSKPLEFHAANRMVLPANLPELMHEAISPRKDDVQPTLRRLDVQAGKSMQ